MAKSVIWKRKAALQVLEIQNYLSDHFSHRDVNRFIDKLYQQLDTLRQYPEIGQRTRFKTIRRLRINRIVSLFYRISGANILIVFVWNNKQEAKRNPYL